MVNQRVAKTRATSDDAITEAAEVQELLKQLINYASQSPFKCEPDGDDREVILDEEINGVRCLLVRSNKNIERPQTKLSPREQEIARMVAGGYPNKTIAAVLDISSWTVGTHIRRIFAKLNVRSRAAMVAKLLEGRTLGEAARHRTMSQSGK